MGYIIENDEGLCWSNKYGWTDSDDFDTFTPEERDTLDLPMGGKWIEVPWSVA